MKRISTICLLVLCIASANQTFAQSRPGKYSLGKTSAFQKQINDQLNASSVGRKKPSFKLNLSEQEILDFNINLRNKPNTKSEQLIGEVQGIEESNFYINIEGSKINGHVLMKKQKRAFKYSSDESGNAFVEPVNINDVLC